MSNYSRRVVVSRSPMAPAAHVTRHVTTSTVEKPKEFRDMQMNMEDEMEKRRRDWDKEVTGMSEDFFNMKAVENTNDKAAPSPARTVKTKMVYATEDSYDDGDKDRSPSEERVKKHVVTKCDNSGGDGFNISHAKSLYSQMPDGKQLFKVKFDVNGFAPDEVAIQTVGSRLTVTAKHIDDGMGGGTNTRQFNRQVQIPNNVDPDKIISFLSDDGILSIEAPVEEELREPNLRYVQRSVLDEPELALEPPGYQSVASRSSKHSLVCNEPQVLDSEYGKKLKLIVDIGRDYTADDITITLLQWKVSIKAEHKENVGGRTSTRKYSRAFDLPERVENRTVIARLAGNGKLYIGGSIRGNRTHEMVMESVELDMPLGGKPVNTSAE